MERTIRQLETELAEVVSDLRIMSKECGDVATRAVKAENDRERAIAKAYIALPEGNSTDRRQAGIDAAGAIGIPEKAAHAKLRADMTIAESRVTGLSSLLKSMNRRANDDRWNDGP